MIPVRWNAERIYPVKAFSLAMLAVLIGSALPSGAGSQDLPLRIRFSLRSVTDGNWSDAKTWNPARVPRANDRVLVSRGTRVVYDAKSDDVIRLIQVVGTLAFARDRDTLLNVGVLKVQNSDTCTESGFACDFMEVNKAGEPQGAPAGGLPTLEVGTPDAPIPAEHRARIRLHYLEGMNKNDAPAVACCSARMEFHGAPMSRTWVELGADVAMGDKTVTLDEEVTGWRAGDEIIVTASKRGKQGRTFRNNPDGVTTEERRIEKIEGRKITVRRPFVHPHSGTGKGRSEVANLSRNVSVESADPDGVRGHTVYHRFSRGGISYARFAHLGKENVLGRYSLHFHVLGDTMRGTSVVGAAIVDSHNRWVTIHGTEYMVVRDCVGYRSVGHGFFLEDGSEVYNVLDRNLGVQAFDGRRLPNQVLPFDPNDGAAFWWANGRNTFVRNVACENDTYGFRFDSQNRSNFDSTLAVMMPDGRHEDVDIRTIPFYRFQDNESHTEGLYSFTLAGTDGVGPDTRHPHVVRDLNIWNTHYALRAQLPTMRIENVRIDRAAYGIYRPRFENHEYINLHIARTDTEPFNRGLDDRSAQHGKITVDGLTFEGLRRSGMPMIQISANNLGGEAESHFRNVKVTDDGNRRGRALVNLGGGPRLTPKTEKGVPVYIHDWYGKGRHAKIVSTRADDWKNDGVEYREDPPLTGDESRAGEVRDVPFPKLLDPVDDLPPATIVTWPRPGLTVTAKDGEVVIRGTTTDNGSTRRVIVNGIEAEDVDYNFHQWRVRLKGVACGPLKIRAHAVDAAGNVEKHAHEFTVSVK